MQIYRTPTELQKASLPAGDVIMLLGDGFGGGLVFCEIKTSGTGYSLPNGNVAVVLTYGP